MRDLTELYSKKVLVLAGSGNTECVTTVKHIIWEGSYPPLTNSGTNPLNVSTSVPPVWTKSSIKNKLIVPDNVAFLSSPLSVNKFYNPSVIFTILSLPTLILLQVIVIIFGSLGNNFSKRFLAPSSGKTIIFVPDVALIIFK